MNKECVDALLGLTTMSRVQNVPRALIFSFLPLKRMEALSLSPGLGFRVSGLGFAFEADGSLDFVTRLDGSFDFVTRFRV